MRLSTAFAALAAAAVATLVAADDPAPNRWLGAWRGTVSQSFALANASDPSSYECLTGNTVITRTLTFNISSTTALRDGLPAATVTIGQGNYTAPSEAARTFTWGTLESNNILKLRNGAGVIECYYARLTGSGDNRRITILTLGGDAVNRNFMLQCDPANYERLPSYLSQPYCSTAGGGSAVAVNSTVLATLSYTGGGLPDNSGAGSVGVSAAVGLGAALALAAAALARRD